MTTSAMREALSICILANFRRASRAASAQSAGCEITTDSIPVARGATTLSITRDGRASAPSVATIPTRASIRARWSATFTGASARTCNSGTLLGVHPSVDVDINRVAPSVRRYSPAQLSSIQRLTDACDVKGATARRQSRLRHDHRCNERSNNSERRPLEIHAHQSLHSDVL